MDMSKLNELGLHKWINKDDWIIYLAKNMRYVSSSELADQNYEVAIAAFDLYITKYSKFNDRVMALQLLEASKQAKKKPFNPSKCLILKDKIEERILDEKIYNYTPPTSLAEIVFASVLCCLIIGFLVFIFK